MMTRKKEVNIEKTTFIIYLKKPSINTKFISFEFLISFFFTFRIMKFDF